MGMDMMWRMPGMMFIGAFVWLLILAVIGLGIWWLVREFLPSRRDHALELLRERYARGEIDREEFEARRRDLVA
jgi:putative membrane protein